MTKRVKPAESVELSSDFEVFGDTSLAQDLSQKGYGLLGLIWVMFGPLSCVLWTSMGHFSGCGRISHEQRGVYLVRFRTYPCWHSVCGCAQAAQGHFVEKSWRGRGKVVDK